MKEYIFQFSIRANSSEEAEAIKMELAGSNDGSKMIANADWVDVNEV